MRRISRTHHFRVILVTLLCGVLSVNGCKRSKYRLEADRDAYCAIAEKNCDPRWFESDYDIEIDPRSRYYERYNEDCPPMPPDDPTSHQYMHCVNGHKGWKHWHDNGSRCEVENPAWLSALPSYVRTTENGAVVLTVDSALALGYVHSPSLQSQLETLYLSALDVTTERFRLDTQYFGGFDTVYQHDGRLRPERNLLTVGRGSGALPFPGGGLFGGGGNALSLNRRFATAGELMVGFANSFVWEFTGGDFNFASSVLNGSFVQPLLRGAGADRALETLTIAERTLLANVRAYHYYRQGFYTQIAVGQLGVSGPQRRGGFFGGTGLTGFTGQGAGGFGGVGGGTFGGGFAFGGGGGGGSGQGFAGGGAGTVGGLIGLLQQRQQIRNTEASLALQRRTLALLEAHLDAGVIDLAQVDQFRQSIETERANLLQAHAGLNLGVEGYLTGTLGLPPDLPVELDDSMIRRFQLVSPEASELQNRITLLQEKVGDLPDDADVEVVEQALAYGAGFVQPVRTQLEEVRADLTLMDDAVSEREKAMSDLDQRYFERDRKELGEKLAELEQEFDEISGRIEKLVDKLSNRTRKNTVRDLVVWLSDIYRFAQGSSLLQARARLEAVTIKPVNMSTQEAFNTAVANRLDFMNLRASLTDSWRLIAFNADQLQANVSIAVSGDLRTSGDNPTRFDGRNSTVRTGVQFDAPFTRLLERNNYRQSLIDYQRARRGFIQAHDSLKLGLRNQLRTIEQLRQNLEIQRRAVVISIRRVDLSREELNRPVPPAQPGQPPAQFGPTAARNLLDALSDLRNTQNNFMSVWLNYYAARMTLGRNLGIMMLDDRGRWIDAPLPSFSIEAPLTDEAPEIPPPVPEEWIDLADRIPELPTDTTEASADTPNPESAHIASAK